MVKIKTKKQLNLPQLIEYIVKNDLRNKMFTSDSKSVEPGVIYVSAIGAISTQLSVYGNELFTIEVEEEITEDTVIPELVELYEDTLTSNEGSNEILINENISIRRAKDEDECPSRAFYIINDDLTLDLIWRDGKMVE